VASYRVGNEYSAAPEADPTRITLGSRAKEATMNHFITTVIWVTVESSIASFAIDQAEVLRIAALVENKRPSNYQGDFPIPSNRKYAEADAEHEGIVPRPSHWPRRRGPREPPSITNLKYLS
jgi:hypothetical protein